MKERSDKVFDQLLREKFSNFSETPPPVIWDQISTQLDRSSSRRFPYARLAAACVLLLGAAGFWFKWTQPEEIGQVVVKTTNIPIEVETQPAQPSSSEELIPQTRSTNEAIASPKSNLARKTVQEHVVRVAVEPKSADVKAKIEHAVEHVATNSPTAIAIQEVPAIAQTQTDTDTEEEPVRPKRRLSSLGALVNFVVSKVDSREDKIIEFSEQNDDDGLRLVGLNLGPVKFKNNVN